jgi:hypothetical protein
LFVVSIESEKARHEKQAGRRVNAAFAEKLYVDRIDSMANRCIIGDSKKRLLESFIGRPIVTAFAYEFELELTHNGNVVAFCDDVTAIVINRRDSLFYEMFLSELP